MRVLLLSVSLWLAVLAQGATLAASPELMQSSPTREAFQGQVLDPSGLPIAGARVTAVPDGGTTGASALTDASGRFTIPLDSGSYTLRIAAPGFVEGSYPIAAGATRGGNREFKLEIAALREVVNVSAEAGYQVPAISSATKTPTPLRDIPQSVSIVTQELIKDQLMTNVGDVIRYVPGITTHQGENNRDQVIIRGNSSSADFFVNGVRDDVQYYRDLYNLDHMEALKGPNAMIFGRGGGGGVVNRVIKEAGFQPLREFTVQAGGYAHRRVTADFDQPLTDKVALRLNGMFENSESFRTDVDLERGGINPTLTFAPSNRTKVTFSYEYFHDGRVADRGITSLDGRPVVVDESTYYGNPNDSDVKADVNLVTGLIEHRMGRLTIRNRTLIGDYDRFYQNYVPGAVSADRSQVALTAYNNATERRNVFNQTDLVYSAQTGQLLHTLLFGTEFGHQRSDNFRNTGFFNDATTSLQVPFANPTISTPVTYRQSVTDADNQVRVSVAAAFVQDQVELSHQVQLLAGVRFDRFDLDYDNNRNGDQLERTDDLVSPRVGLVFKPITPVSIYGSYSVSYLPSSGDQFGSLTNVTQQVEPEKFNNYEVGVKWDVRPEVSVTSAVYRLDRTNTRSTDPNDPTRIVQTGSQRTNGFELGVAGSPTPLWRLAGGYAYQDAFVTSATVAARDGAVVGQVPLHTFSLWNHYQFHTRVSGGLGIIHRSDMFATIDNSVLLEGYTRADAAAYYSITKDLRLQANIENLFDSDYFMHADSNTNISPGFPRTLRVALTARF